MSGYNPVTTWIWLSALGRPNREIRLRLFDEYDTLENIWKAGVDGKCPSFMKAGSVKQQKFNDTELRKRAERIHQQAKSLGMSICTPEDPFYPPLLKELYAAPCVLYYYGRLPAQVTPDMPLLSAVGARACSAYGLRMADWFAGALSQAGVGIVSGMARGIDGAIHKGVLKTGGYTVAVLASGADMVYPPEHRVIYERICETGCVITELPPAVPPDRRNFPARNRIIAGLTPGTLVIEAKKESGAMITVEQALSNNRTIYAIPGNLGVPTSEGCNGLIREGAQCVTKPEDILEDMGYTAPCTAISQDILEGLSKTEKRILDAVLKGAVYTDAIAAFCGLPPGAVNAGLTLLEIKGFLGKNGAGAYYPEKFHFTEL